MLAPLACPSCGRPVPRGDAATTRCRACDTVVEIPPSHLELRAAHALDDDARARAELIANELARPTSLPMQIWITAGGIAMLLAIVVVLVWLLVSLVMCIGTFFDGGPIGAVIMLIMGLVLGLPLLWDEALHGLADDLKVDLADVWGGALAFGLLGMSFWVLTALPMILASYASSFEAVRTALRTALAAKPAPAIGEDEQCRSCGGVLEAPESALHARCVYCDADNLVHLDRARLDEAVGELKVVARDLHSALAEERGTARAGRMRAAIRLAQWLALAPLMIILGRCVASINENDAFFWEPADGDAPMVPANEANPVLPRGEPVRFAVRKTFDRCDDAECVAIYFVPLAAGERPRLDVDGGDLRLGEAQQRFVGPWYDPTYEWRHVDLEDGAPYSGWYRIELVTSKAIGPDSMVTFR